MFYKLYGTNITPACSICEKSEQRDEGLYCRTSGTVEPDGHCRRFKYDPLKREPKIPRELESFDNSDFSLEVSGDEA